jgi:hypothetical protein
VHELDDLVSFVLSFRARATGEAVSLCDVVGFLASGLVVAAFCMKDLVPLRLMALASNVAFLVYGIGLGLAPIWLLHAILLPVNCWRLWQQLSQYGEAAPTMTRPHRGDGAGHRAPGFRAITGRYGAPD